MKHVRVGRWFLFWWGFARWRRFRRYRLSYFDSWDIGPFEVRRLLRDEDV